MVIFHRRNLEQINDVGEKEQNTIYHRTLCHEDIYSIGTGTIGPVSIDRLVWYKSCTQRLVILVPARLKPWAG
jgi:hypothetical protein